jgi:DNA mismatch repair ATPase MutL
MRPRRIRTTNMRLIHLLAVASLSAVLAACETPKPSNTDTGKPVNRPSTGDSSTGAPSSSGSTTRPSTDSGRPTPSASRPSTDQPSSQSSSSSPTPSPAASTPPTKPSEPTPETAASKAEQLLTEGTELYEKGDYKGAIRKLQASRDGSDDTSTTKQNSLRLLAFSYCVTSQRALCKAQFTSLLKLNPSFELSRAEAGHPLWGPVFKEAKVVPPPPKPVKKP